MPRQGRRRRSKAVIDRREDRAMSPRDLMRALGRRWWVVALIVALATSAAFLLASRQTKMFRATAKIVYEPQVSAGAAAAGQSVVDPYGQQDAVQSVATAINNPTIQWQTATIVGRHARYTLTAQSDDSSSANGLVNAVVSISATSSDPSVARDAANGFASAFIASRKQAQVGRLDVAIDALKLQMATFKTQASRQTSSYLLLAQSAQSLEVSRAMATGDFSLTVPASLPTGPFKPRPLVDGALALGVSLFVAIGLVLVLQQFDTRLRSYHDVAQALDMSVIARVPRVKRRKIRSDPLAVVHDTHGPAAESLRLLRSNLDYLDSMTPLSTILVTSGIPGEGKSVTVCNLGVTLAMAGRRVVLIDADLRRASLHRYLGLSNTTGVSSVVAGKVQLAQALQAYRLPPLDWTSLGSSGNGDGARPVSAAGDDGARETARRLFVLTAGPLPPNPGEIIASDRFAAILAELKASKVDYVLVDSPAFMSVSDAAAIAPHVDGVVALVDVDRASWPLLSEVKYFLDRLPTRKLGVIVVREKSARTGYHRYYHYYAGASRS
jgi:Mrp family chromosome partitioning ATPase/capsular polysaccharide biosynthesis protein